MSELPRAVIDTNLVVSALVFSSGRLGVLRRSWQIGAFRPLVSKVTTTELLRVLAYPKFKLTEGERADLLADYLPFCTTVRIPAKPPSIPRCRDPFDAPFLHLALVGKAKYLVTGDRDLLAVAEAFPIPILQPNAFLEALSSRPA